jgi:hypothetical protein
MGGFHPPSLAEQVEMFCPPIPAAELDAFLGKLKKVKDGPP